MGIELSQDDLNNGSMLLYTEANSEFENFGCTNITSVQIWGLRWT